MSRLSVVAKIQEVAARVGAGEGIEIVEVELKGGGRNQIVCIAIDRPEGVTHADCELVSHQVGAILDVEEVFPGHYTLEVSSPGVERKLRKMEDYKRFEGKKAKIVLKEPIQDLKVVEGTLAGVEDSTVFVEIKDGERLSIPLPAINRANLKFEW